MKIQIYLIAFAILFLTAACSKDDDVTPTPVLTQDPTTTTTTTPSPILGCTQINACNYSTVATQDDGSCYFCSDCSGNSLESTSLFQTRDYNLLDYTPSSPYYNQAFSTLTINWFQDDFCTNVVNNFFIEFKNNTNNTITFDYYIESNTGSAVRSAQGVVQNLAPGQTFSKEEGVSAFYNLANYPITVLVNSITYN